MARLAGKTAAETVSVIMAIFKRLSAPMRGSITFDNGTEFAHHSLLQGMLSATTYFCDAYASWQKGGVENTNGRIRRWLPRSADLDAMTDADIQDIAMTINMTPRKCLGFRSPIEAFLEELGNLLFGRAMNPRVSRSCLPVEQEVVLLLQTGELSPLEPIVLDVLDAGFDLAFVTRCVGMGG